MGKRLVVNNYQERIVIENENSYNNLNWFY